MLKRLEKWFAPGLVVRASAIDGEGVFTDTEFAAGDLVMRWGGILVHAYHMNDAWYRRKSTTLYDDSYWLTTPVDEPETLDEWLNHSCDPNTWMADAVTVVARRNIAAGEEITTDAALWLRDDEMYTEACSCGSPLCRTRVTGQDYREPELRRRYRGHFIPCIEARITALEAAAAQIRT